MVSFFGSVLPGGSKKCDSIESSQHQVSHERLESDSGKKCSVARPTLCCDDSLKKDANESLAKIFRSDQRYGTHDIDDQQNARMYRSLESSKELLDENLENDRDDKARNGAHKTNSTSMVRQLSSDQKDLEENTSANRKQAVFCMLRKCFQCCGESLSVWFAVDSYDKTHATKSQIFHLSIFKDVPFMMICLSVIFYRLGQKTVIDFFPAICLERGLSSPQILIVLSVAQVSALFGKLLCGFIMDLPKLRRYMEVSFILMLFSTAALSFTVPLLQNYQMFSVVAGLFSLLVGATTNLRTVFISHLVDENVLSSSYGTMYAFQGVGSLIGPPVSGK
ncbi:monocarboxylate transporter 14 [Plakobranchus ocellatus]|uniref:Monocarboxylate transporter 14 n=1 Tax=Plakobranchus ocellatus TaxID=259542 RepID=A0AAV3Z2Y6_9GAST|nr:monocarboxylate transporter 14 [Plakobranchus ocellatus]